MDQAGAVLEFSVAEAPQEDSEEASNIEEAAEVVTSPSPKRPRSSIEWVVTSPSPKRPRSSIEWVPWGSQYSLSQN